MRDALTAISGTLSVYHEPLMSEGALRGCTFVFEHLTQDHKYLAGDFLRSSGSFGLMSGGGDTVAVVVKVISKLVKPSLTINAEQYDLARAYLVGSNHIGNLDALVDAYESEQPGGIFAVYHLEQSAPQLFDLIENRRATVAIAPPGGGMDILLSIDLSVTSVNDDGTRSYSAGSMTQFTSCFEALLGR